MIITPGCPAYVVTPRPRRGEGSLSSDGSDRSDGLDKSDGEAPRRGAFCVARVSEGRSPDDPGLLIAPLSPRPRQGSVVRGSDPPGVGMVRIRRETRGHRHFVPRHPCYERGTPTGVPRQVVSRNRGRLLGDPQGVVGEGVGRCTSVTASRMTDAYGASTRKGCTAMLGALPSDLIFRAIRIPFYSVNMPVITPTTKRISHFLPC